MQNKSNKGTLHLPIFWGGEKFETVMYTLYFSPLNWEMTGKTKLETTWLRSCFNKKTGSIPWLLTKLYQDRIIQSVHALLFESYSDLQVGSRRELRQAGGLRHHSDSEGLRITQSLWIDLTWHLPAKAHTPMHE